MKPDSGTANVAALVRSKIEVGALPTEKPVKTWVGKGTGLTCDACDLTVTSDDIEYETDLPSQGTFRFHQHCLAVWHEERVKDRTSTS